MKYGVYLFIINRGVITAQPPTGRQKCRKNTPNNINTNCSALRLGDFIEKLGFANRSAAGFSKNPLCVLNKNISVEYFDKQDIIKLITRI